MAANQVVEKSEKGDVEENNFKKNWHHDKSLLEDVVKIHMKHANRREKEIKILKIKMPKLHSRNRKVSSSNDLDDHLYSDDSYNKDIRFLEERRSGKVEDEEAFLTTEIGEILHDNHEINLSPRLSTEDYQCLEQLDDQEFYTEPLHYPQDRHEGVKLHKTKRKRRRSHSRQSQNQTESRKDDLSGIETDLYPGLTNSLSMTHLDLYEANSDDHSKSQFLTDSQNDFSKGEEEQDGGDACALPRNCRTFSRGLELTASLVRPSSADHSRKWQDSGYIRRGNNRHWGGRDNDLASSKQKHRSLSKKQRDRGKKTSLSPVDNAVHKTANFHQRDIEIWPNMSDTNLQYPKHPYSEKKLSSSQESLVKQPPTSELQKQKKRISYANKVMKYEDSELGESSSTMNSVTPFYDRRHIRTSQRDKTGIMERTRDIMESAENMLESLPPRSAWCPSTPPKSSQDSTQRSRHGKTEVVTLSYQHRGLRGQSSSPLHGLPLRATSRPLMVEFEGSRHSNKTVKSDSFKTVPLRIKQTSPKSQYVWKIGRKQSSDQAQISETQETSRRKGSPREASRWIPRQQKPGSRDTVSTKTGGGERKSRDTIKSPVPRRPGFSLSPSQSKPKSPIQRSSQGNDQEKEIPLTLLYRSNAKSRYTPVTTNRTACPNGRSLSAGVVENRVNSGPLNKTTPKPNSPQGRRRPWRENCAGVSTQRSARATPTGSSRERKKQAIPKYNSSSGKAAGKKSGRVKGNEPQVFKSVNSPKSQAENLMENQDNFCCWKVSPSSNSAFLMGPINKLEKKCPGHFESDNLTRVDQSKQVGKDLVPCDEPWKSTEILNISQFKFNTSEKLRDPTLLRFYHLPSSLRDLKSLRVFQSRSVPVACIRGGGTPLNEMETRVDAFPPRLPSSPQRVQEASKADTKAVEPARPSIFPAYKSIPSSTLHSFFTCTGQTKSTLANRPSVERLSESPSSDALRPATPVKFNCQSQTLEPKVTDSWIKRRSGSSTSFSTSVSDNPILKSLTEHPASSYSKDRDIPEALKKRSSKGKAGDDIRDHSVSCFTAKDLCFSRQSPKVPNAFDPGKKSQDETTLVDSESLSLSLHEQKYIFNRAKSMQMIKESHLSGTGPLQRAREAVPGIRCWLRCLVFSLAVVLCLGYYTGVDRDPRLQASLSKISVDQFWLILDKAKLMLLGLLKVLPAEVKHRVSLYIQIILQSIQNGISQYFFSTEGL